MEISQINEEYAHSKGNNRTFSDILLMIFKCITIICVALITYYTLRYTVEKDINDKIIFLQTDWRTIGIGFVGACTVILLLRILRLKISKRVFVLLLFIYTAASIALVCALRLMSTSDQYYITWIASDLIKGEYSQFGEMGYMCLFPFQHGFVRYVYAIFCIFGPDNYIAVQIMNVLFVTGIIWFMVKISSYIFPDKEEKYEVGIAMMLFLPLTFFTTFIYGTLPSVFFSVLSVYFLLRYFDKEQKKALNAAVVIIANAIAIILKCNGMLFTIAESIVLIFHALKKKDVKRTLSNIALILAIWVCYFVAATITYHDLHRYTYTDKVGTPKITWIAMGLQEGGPAEGWHNFYNRDVYWDNDCDAKTATLLAKESIRNSFAKFREDPAYAKRFFSKKIISEWTNPAFESFYIIQNSLTRNKDENKPNGIVADTLFPREDGKSLDSTSKGFNYYLKVFEIIIMIGALYCVIFNKMTVNSCILPMTFVGGLIFHTFWEASCRYMLPYFVIMIPYGVAGIEMLFDKVVHLKKPAQHG